MIDYTTNFQAVTRTAANEEREVMLLSWDKCTSLAHETPHLQLSQLIGIPGTMNGGGEIELILHWPHTLHN